MLVSLARNATVRAASPGLSQDEGTPVRDGRTGDMTEEHRLLDQRIDFEINCQVVKMYLLNKSGRGVLGDGVAIPQHPTSPLLFEKIRKNLD